MITMSEHDACGHPGLFECLLDFIWFIFQFYSISSSCKVISLTRRKPHVLVWDDSEHDPIMLGPADATYLCATCNWNSPCMAGFYSVYCNEIQLPFTPLRSPHLPRIFEYEDMRRPCRLLRGLEGAAGHPYGRDTYIDPPVYPSLSPSTQPRTSTSTVSPTSLTSKHDDDAQSNSIKLVNDLAQR